MTIPDNIVKNIGHIEDFSGGDKHWSPDNYLETTTHETYGRGVREYAELLDLSVSDLLRLVSGRDVIDWGGGRGKFAAELEILRYHSEYKSPRSIITVNNAYKRSEYDAFYHFREKANNDKLFLEILPELPNGSMRLPYDHELVVDAWERAMSNRLAIDWLIKEDLQTIPSESADIMISVCGFPYYAVDLSGYIEDVKNVNSKPEIALMTFKELGRILRHGGTMELQTGISYKKWNDPTSIQRRDTLTKWLHEECEVSLVTTRKSPIADNRPTAVFSMLKQ